MQLWLLCIVVGAVLTVLALFGVASTIFGWLGVLALAAGAILTLTTRGGRRVGSV